mgnify:CR=1 FL=1
MPYPNLNWAARAGAASGRALAPGTTALGTASLDPWYRNVLRKSWEGLGASPEPALPGLWEKSQEGLGSFFGTGAGAPVVPPKQPGPAQPSLAQAATEAQADPHADIPSADPEKSHIRFSTSSPTLAAAMSERLGFAPGTGLSADETYEYLPRAGRAGAEFGSGRVGTYKQLAPGEEGIGDQPTETDTGRWLVQMEQARRAGLLREAQLGGQQGGLMEKMQHQWEQNQEFQRSMQNLTGHYQQRMAVAAGLPPEGRRAAELQATEYYQTLVNALKLTYGQPGANPYSLGSRSTSEEFISPAMSGQ